MGSAPPLQEVISHGDQKTPVDSRRPPPPGPVNSTAPLHRQEREVRPRPQPHSQLQDPKHHSPPGPQAPALQHRCLPCAPQLHPPRPAQRPAALLPAPHPAVAPTAPGPEPRSCSRKRPGRSGSALSCSLRRDASASGPASRGRTAACTASSTAAGSGSEAAAEATVAPPAGGAISGPSASRFPRAASVRSVRRPPPPAGNVRREPGVPSAVRAPAGPSDRQHRGSKGTGAPGGPGRPARQRGATGRGQRPRRNAGAGPRKPRSLPAPRDLRPHGAGKRWRPMSAGEGAGSFLMDRG